MLAPLTAACVAAAASAFAVPEPLLWVILRAEGGRVGACTPNTNGTRDCGPAQVNAEVWGPHLARVLGRPRAEVERALRDDGCFNVHAGAYVLRAKLREARGDLWDAAGRYNSATPVHKFAYQVRLVASHAALSRAAPGRAADAADAAATARGRSAPARGIPQRRGRSGTPSARSAAPPG